MKSRGAELPPGCRSASANVPAAVPSLTHGSRPRPMLASNNTLLPNGAIEVRLELPLPGVRSATSVTAAFGPVSRRSSLPAAASSAANQRLPPATVKSSGAELATPALMSA